MMTKIGNMQKIMISLDIFAEEKSFLNWPEKSAFFFWTEDTWDTLYSHVIFQSRYEYMLFWFLKLDIFNFLILLINCIYCVFIMFLFKIL